MNSEPPPWPSSSCTTFQAWSGCPSGSVPIRRDRLAAEMGGRPDRAELRMDRSWRRGRDAASCLVSTRAASLPSLVSTTATLLRALAATRK